MRLLAIDPGISSGWAEFAEDGRVVACGCPNVPERLRSYDAVAIEKPVAYPDSPINPNNLITLAIRVGEYAQRFAKAFPGVALYLPEARQWKGQVTKEAHHPRLWAALSGPERDLVQQTAAGKTKKAQGDLMDAIGIGKWVYAHKGLLRDVA